MSAIHMYKNPRVPPPSRISLDADDDALQLVKCFLRLFLTCACLVVEALQRRITLGASTGRGIKRDGSNVKKRERPSPDRASTRPSHALALRELRRAACIL